MAVELTLALLPTDPGCPSMAVDAILEATMELRTRHQELSFNTVSEET